MEFLLIPALLVLSFSLAIGAAWLLTRGRFQYLLSLAAGFGLFGIAITLQFMALPAILSAALYVAGITFISYGLLMRAGEHALPLPLLILAVAIVMGVAFFAYVDDSVQARAYILNFGLGAILLYPLWTLRHLMSGSMADRSLFWVVLIMGVHFFPRTLLTAPYLTTADAAQFTGSLFWTTAIYASAAFTLLLGMSVIFSVALDVVDILQKDRDTDPLTGVWNRRGLDIRLEEILADPRKRPVSLIIGDIDHFKRVNDRWGHAAGDKVLVTFTQIIKQSTRGDDVVARIGGEEFVVAVPRASVAEALALAERIRTRTATADLSAIGDGLAITCSFGVVMIAEEEGPWEAVTRADALLYVAKHKGRNRAVGEDSPDAFKHNAAPPPLHHVRKHSPPASPQKRGDGPAVH